MVINIPIYNLPKLSMAIMKRSVPFSLENHPIINRFVRGDSVMYKNTRYEFYGVVASKVKKPKCELFAYALKDAKDGIFMVLDIHNVRLMGDA